MRKLLILQPEFSGPHMKHYDPDTKQGTLVNLLDLQSAGSSPNLTYTKSSVRDAIRIL